MGIARCLGECKEPGTRCKTSQKRGQDLLGAMDGGLVAPHTLRRE